MALPPGTSGWLGSGFDCTCECNFVAGFAYMGNEPAYWGQDPPPICLLMFAVGNLVDGCEPIDISTADITVELFVNGSPINEPLTMSSNALYWERWKPDAGDVYTAIVTLDCGYGTIRIMEYEYTIPTPANTNCNCCTERTPDYVVVSGFTDEFAIMNGTFALTFVGGDPDFLCCYDPAPGTAAPDLPINPCGIRTGPTTVDIPPECLFAVPPSGIDPFTAIGFYYYPGSGGVQSICWSAITGEVTFNLVYSYKYARRRPADVTIGNPEGCIENGGGGSLGYELSLKISCQTGVAEILSNTFPSQSPTVTVVFQ